MRAVAGDACRRQAVERYRNAKALPISAASCSRRNRRSSWVELQSNMAPALPSRRSCSADQRVSSSRSASIQRIESRRRPARFKAGAYAIRRPSRQSAARSGRQRLSSPTPSQAGMISIRVPSGQPPAGRASSSSGNPVGWVVGCGDSLPPSPEKRRVLQYFRQRS